MTRYSQAEKMEIIRLVETSELPVKQTLAELDVPRSTFYDWYRRYVEAGYDGLADRQPQRQQFWNHIPDSVREQVVEVAFDGVQTSPRYPGGVALRFARVVRYRDDKSPAEADTIDTVRAFYERGGP